MSEFALYPVEKHWWSFNDYRAVLDTVRRLSARRVLEFGPGSSTLALVEGGAELIDTCEDDPKWYHVHRDRVGRQFAPVVSVHLYTWADPLELPALEGGRYDMALIDGPHDTPRRPVVLEYCMAHAAAVLIPTEDYKVSSPPLRPHIHRIAAAHGAALEIWDTGPTSGSFALLTGHTVGSGRVVESAARDAMIERTNQLHRENDRREGELVEQGNLNTKDTK